MTLLSAIQRRDAEARERRAGRPGPRHRRRDQQTDPTKKQVSEAATATVAEYPEFIDYYIRWKEERGDKASAQAKERVRDSEEFYIEQVREFVGTVASRTDFYSVGGSTIAEAKIRVGYLKEVIENQDGWRIFYAKGKPIRREADLHILFRLTWFWPCRRLYSRDGQVTPVDSDPAT